MHTRTTSPFQVNDYIFHGGSGVCKVQDICTPDMHRIDPSKTYYRLLPLYDKGSVIYTPTDSTTAVLRRIITREEALNLIEQLPALEIIWFDNDKYREEKYREALRTNDCTQWMRVIKTLYTRNEERKLEGKRIAQADEKFLRIAEDLLYGELAISLGIAREDVLEFIAEHAGGELPREEQCS